MQVNDLPSEILDKILFGAMESEEDPFALTATLVCRRWRDIMMPRLKKQKTKQKTEHQGIWIFLGSTSFNINMVISKLIK